ncbi:MAG: hypothetical protein IPK64_18900 [bacterium]|nr:hypothetical protein [bacterium]
MGMILRFPFQSGPPQMFARQWNNLPSTPPRRPEMNKTLNLSKDALRVLDEESMVR